MPLHAFVRLLASRGLFVWLTEFSDDMEEGGITEKEKEKKRSDPSLREKMSLFSSDSPGMNQPSSLVFSLQKP